MNKIILTPREWDIIYHRLSVPDALADCLSDDSNWDWQECFDTVCDMTIKLKIAAKENGRVEIVLDGLNDIQKASLRDCVDGSTYFASSEDALATGEINRGQLLAWTKCAHSIEAKFEAAGLKTTGFPMR